MAGEALHGEGGGWGFLRGTVPLAVGRSLGMHSGTFILTAEPIDEPPVKLAHAMLKYYPRRFFGASAWRKRTVDSGFLLDAARGKRKPAGHEWHATSQASRVVPCGHPALLCPALPCLAHHARSADRQARRTSRRYAINLMRQFTVYLRQCLFSGRLLSI